MHSLTFSITLFSIVQLYLKRLQKTQNKKQVNKKAFFSQNENKYFLVYMHVFHGKKGTWINWCLAVR